MVIIDEMLVGHLLTAQFPCWKDLPIRPVAQSGWDNRTFHLGDDLLVRLPSSAAYAMQVEKEQQWLPHLSPHLPLLIPQPVALGKPEEKFPWKWSIYRWLPGQSLAAATVKDLASLATSLAEFLLALQRIDATNGPLAGSQSFYRGGSLTVYDAQAKQALAALKGKIDVEKATEIWESACSSAWQQASVWVHGDISTGNLLVENDTLVAVIDFGQLAVGDPACDLSIAWTLFRDESRERFCSLLPYDSHTWTRARGWTLWKALITAAGIIQTNNREGARCWSIIEEVMS